MATGKDIIAREVEDALAELASVPTPEPEAPPESNDHPALEQFWAQTTRASYEPHYQNPFPVHAMPVPKVRLKTVVRRKIPRVLLILIGFFALAGFTAASFHSSTIVAKQQLLQDGAQAIANLEHAKHNLEALQFSEAADNFALADGDFGKASGTLANFGASFLSLFGNVPGLAKVRSANNLAEAGQRISKSGEHLARAFATLSTTNFFALINPNGTPNGQSLAKPLSDFKDVLEYADANIAKARDLVNDVDITTIPDDKQAVFESFKAKIPDFQEYIGRAMHYSDFLLGVVGEYKPKTYLVLLQNTSERRPAGGFPGTYAIVSFDHGSLKKVFVDDIYNIDGQARVNVMPPLPLAHITPTWGVRDANWFADFPTTARKVEEYYQIDGGAKLDGVLAMTPAVITKILGIIGPVEMPEYHVTLTKDNFLAEVQDQVEVKGDRTQPKKIVVDFQQKFFAKLAQQNKDHWLAIGKVFLEALQRKEIMAYFNDDNLQKEMLTNGFGGELKQTAGDYLEVAFSNVKGGKADAVTANSMHLATSFTSDLPTGQAGTLRHTLTITRVHNGGDSKYAFYNTDNPAYLKVYVPDGAIFEGIEGISKPGYQSLIAHLDLGFKKDPDLATIEQGTTHPVDGVDVFEESGKTVFGFWMITKPKKTSTVTVRYHTSAQLTDTYQLYWQKQSGSDGDQMHVMVKESDGSIKLYDDDLSVDRETKVVLN